MPDEPLLKLQKKIAGFLEALSRLDKRKARREVTSTNTGELKAERKRDSSTGSITAIFHNRLSSNHHFFNARMAATMP